jgi:hypothetical protein
MNEEELIIDFYNSNNFENNDKTFNNSNLSTFKNILDNKTGIQYLND